jgi:transcriptional regulator with XRE-family HTH domain
MASKKAIQQRFGERIRQLRKKQGLSQEELAEKCDLDRTYISGIERGLRNVSIANIEKLSTALGISLSKLTEGL